jgi:hypothetical protein
MLIFFGERDRPGRTRRRLAGGNDQQPILNDQFSMPFEPVSVQTPAWPADNGADARRWEEEEIRISYQAA